MAGNRSIQCLGPSYMLADRKAAVQRTINLYLVEITGLGEDRQAIMRSAPGLVSYIAAGATLRGSYDADGRWFVVAGTGLYEVVSGSLVSRGTLPSASGYVGMKHGESQLVLVDGANGYVLNLATNVFTAITSSGWRGSDYVDHLDGYFIFVDPDTEQFYISGIDDASALDALDFSSADKQPDNILTHRVFKGELYLFGTTSCEIWINSGDPDFPLTRYNSTPIAVGVVGKRAVCVAADTLFFVGQTARGHGYVYQMQGYQPVRISQQAVEEALNASAVDLSQCVLWTYHVEGNEFIGVEAPGMATTWVFDASTKQWHERARLVNGDWIVLGIDHVTFQQGVHYCAYGSTLYQLDMSENTLGGEVLARERTWPHMMSPSLEPITYGSLELLCSTGEEGAVTLEISNDGGYRWGPPLLRRLGATGRFAERVRWVGLGSANDRVFRIRCTDAVPFSIYAAAVEAS